MGLNCVLQCSRQLYIYICVCVYLFLEEFGVYSVELNIDLNIQPLQGEFAEYESKSYQKLKSSIEAHPSKAVQEVLKSFLGKIYKREK